jgi:hypothetical protein
VLDVVEDNVNVDVVAVFAICVPVYVMVGLIATIVNVDEPDEAFTFVVPAYAYEAVAVPGFVLFTYVGVTVELTPGAVTFAVHAAIAAPVYVDAVVGHVTVVTELAFVIANVLAVATTDAWLVSPAYVYAAVAVPTFVLFVYVGVAVRATPTLEIATEQGVIAAAVYTKVVPVHVIVAVDGALEIVNVLDTVTAP